MGQGLGHMPRHQKYAQEDGSTSPPSAATCRIMCLPPVVRKDCDHGVDRVVLHALSCDQDQPLLSTSRLHYRFKLQRFQCKSCL